METLIYIYYGLMLICFAASLFYFDDNKVKLLAVLLFCSIITEILVEYTGKEGKHFYLYHLFSLIEYTLGTLIISYDINNSRLKMLMLFSIPLFLILASFIYLEVQKGSDYPSIIGTIENSLLSIWALIGLFSIDPKEVTPILKRTFFWFCLAFLVYYSGTIAVNGAYNYLLKNKSQEAKFLYSVMNSIFNYLLYGCLTTGIIYSKWKMK